MILQVSPFSTRQIQQVFTLTFSYNICIQSTDLLCLVKFYECIKRPFSSAGATVFKSTSYIIPVDVPHVIERRCALLKPSRDPAYSE